MDDTHLDRMRPPRAKSPNLTRHQSLRQRLPQKNTEEIIKFVRELQFERQPTLLRLQKKVPLPGIGKYAQTKTGTKDSGFQEKVSDNIDSEEEVLDNEVAYIDRNSNPRLDPFLKNVFTCPRVTNINCTKDYEILSRSFPSGSLENNVMIPSQCTSRQTSFVSNRSKKVAKDNNPRHGRLKQQLPPIEREDLPERPQAPSPSRTPPPNSNVENMMPEEPIDYIDPA